MRWLAALLIIVGFIIPALSWQALPDQVASHWNAQGEADGTMGKFWGLFLVPFIMAAMYLLFLLLPGMDPKGNIRRFQAAYDRFILIMILFFIWMELLIVGWNLGLRFDFTMAFMPAMGALFYFIGDLFRDAKQNWFVGIRTPWTLSSERVWKKTHERGVTVFRAMGVLFFIGAFLPCCHIWVILVPVLGSSFYLFIYSYVLFKREKHLVKNTRK